MIQVGIVGMGVVGNAISQYHRSKGDIVSSCDVRWSTYVERLADLNENAEVVFICVGTPSGVDGLLDCSAVGDAIDRLTGKKTVIIKSTVNPGTTDRLQKENPKHRIFFVPEFLTAKTAVEDYANPRRRHIVGVPGSVWYAYYRADDFVLNWLPDFENMQIYGVLPAREAELLKLATNAFYAFKVTYANMLHDMGMSQDAISALGKEPWIGAEHFTIDHDGYRGFGGACLPKDTMALRTLAENGQPEMSVILKAMQWYNDQLIERQKPQYDEAGLDAE